MLSNSFHSSTKSHSISTAGGLAKAERHNSRGYFSLYYDKDKISDLVGTADTLVNDVTNAINQTFGGRIEEYNERQRRKDRKIQGTAFEYFCKQKKLDIASEAIFQIGDQEFWSKFRKDTLVNKNGKQYILKSYPKEVKDVMDDIFKRQISAYENIYETHGAAIAAKIQEEWASSFDVAQKAEADYPDFKEIYKMDSKPRTEKINCLDGEAQTRFAAYFDARNTMATIVKLKLRERIEEHQMHIKMVGATAHYDEWSPHAHGISICYADGYSTGLSSRIAKSVVLNRWALEVIQGRLNEIAQEEISKHPEIFVGEVIKPTEKGRNYDYTVEQITRYNLVKLGERIEAAEASERQAKANALEAQKNATDARIEANRVHWQADEERRHLMSLRGAIQSIEEYDFEADELQDTIDNTDRMIDDARELVNCAAPSERRRASELFEQFAERVRIQLDKLIGVLYRLFGFEEMIKMPDEERRTPALADRIDNAAARVNNVTWKDEIEPRR